MIDQIEAQNKHVSFRIIAASIPGFAYSRTSHNNHVVDPIDVAILFDSLMRYEKANSYYVHGEDWGSIVASAMAQLFPDRVDGIHLTFPVAFETNSLFDLGYYLIGYLFPFLFYTQQEIELKFPERHWYPTRIWNMWAEFGYLHLQVGVTRLIQKINKKTIFNF